LKQFKRQEWLNPFITKTSSNTAPSAGRRCCPKIPFAMGRPCLPGILFPLSQPLSLMYWGSTQTRAFTFCHPFCLSIRRTGGSMNEWLKPLAAAAGVCIWKRQFGKYGSMDARLLVWNWRPAGNYFVTV